MVSQKNSKAHEAQHASKQEAEFKATARRNKLLGLWAAEHLGLSGAAAEAYAKEVIHADFDEPGDEDVVRKVLGDLAKRGAPVSEADLRKKMESLLATAKLQIAQEQK